MSIIFYCAYAGRVFTYLFLVANGFIQLFVSHRLIEKLGARTAYKLAFANQVTLLVCLAAIGILVPSRGVDTLIKSLLVFYLCLVTFTSIGYGMCSFMELANPKLTFTIASIYVFIIDSASDSTLGSINGLSQMVASIMRALAPTIVRPLPMMAMLSLGWYCLHEIILGLFAVLGLSSTAILPRRDDGVLDLDWNNDIWHIHVYKTSYAVVSKLTSHSQRAIAAYL